MLDAAVTSSADAEPEAPPRRLECMEIWGGNQAVDDAIAVSGLDAWLVSRPHGGAVSGGDVHFVSTCGGGRLARFVVADVAGHGLLASDLAVNLRRLMRKNINRLDQTRLVRRLNRAFSRFSRDGKFATALLASYFAPTDHLVICNAGHPRPLWYRSRLKIWQQLHHDMADRVEKVSNLPLGIVMPTSYYQFAVCLEKGDLVLIYTDAVVEVRDAGGKILNDEGLLELVGRLDATRPESFCPSLLNAVSAYREHRPEEDDVTLVLLHHNAGRPPRQSIGEMVKVMGKMFGLIKV